MCMRSEKVVDRNIHVLEPTSVVADSVAQRTIFVVAAASAKTVHVNRIAYSDGRL